jgi:hypothetical protein
MPARKPPPPDEKPQFERFIETVRKVGADETDEALDRAIRKIIGPTPARRPQKGEPRSRGDA